MKKQQKEQGVTSAARLTMRAADVQQRYDHDRALLQQRYGDRAPCMLCDRAPELVPHRTATMQITVNDYPYEQFDGMVVDTHLMLVPVRHVATIDDFTQQEQQEYLQLIALFHRKGYASMTRSSTDSNRSVPAHIHTHLMKYGQEV